MFIILQQLPMGEGNSRKTDLLQLCQYVRVIQFTVFKVTM